MTDVCCVTFLSLLKESYQEAGTDHRKREVSGQNRRVEISGVFLQVGVIFTFNLYRLCSNIATVKTNQYVLQNLHLKVQEF